MLTRLFPFILLACSMLGSHAHAAETLRLAVIGLDHGHVEGALWNAMNREDLTIVGIYDPNPALFEKYKEKYGLDPAWFSTDLGLMLDETKPEAASVMTPISDHLAVVQACAPRGVHTLLEKPLAFNYDDAKKMAALAEEHGVLVLTNFETSWYASVRTAQAIVGSDDDLNINRVIFRHGHKGPKEIGCSEEFLDWLTDPEKNGGGALTDFGCYGAGIMTWLMDNQRPISVTAVTQHLKPEVYPDVDDDATIILTYPTATAVIQASWAWTHDNKEMDIHATGMSLHTEKWDMLSLRTPDAKPTPQPVIPKPKHLENEWTYLRMVVRGECEIDPLSSIETNLIVAQILDAARDSAASGRVVRLDDRDWPSE